VKKAQGGLPKSLRETLSAFANTQGGVIILGLDETQGFRATGLPDPAKLAADLASMCSEDMEPPLRPLIKIHPFEEAQAERGNDQLDPPPRPTRADRQAMRSPRSFA
jgi:ATP-dependent DNA helicase RecG